MLGDLKKISVFILLIVSSPIWIPLLLIFKLFERPAKISPETVMGYLRRMESGEVDEYYWDDFVNVPIRDPDLDAIRQKCSEIWTYEDPQFLKQVGENDFVLNERGMNEVKLLIQKCESMQAEARKSGLTFPQA